MATKPAPPYSRGRVSALGVFAEIDTLLARHRQKTSLATALPLQEKISRVLPTLGIKNIPEEKLKQITSDIAQETISQTLEDVAKAQTPEQISLVLADSLTQSIINHPDLAGKIKADDDTKVFTEIVPHAQEVASQNQDILEKAAVLANLDNIAKIQDQTEQIKDLIAGSVEQTAETEAPLTPPAQREALKADLANYLKSYKEELAKQLQVTDDNIPSLKDLQEAKENAHTQATKKMAPATAIPPKILTENLAKTLYLKPAAPISTPPKLPAGGNLILASPTRVRDAYLSLLSFDQEKLARALKETSEEIEKYKNKKSLAYRERRAYQDALKKQARYVAAQAFHVKQPKKAGAYRTLFARAFGGRAEVASGQAWIAEKYFLTSMPRVVAHNERLAAGAAFGSLGFGLGNFHFGGRDQALTMAMGVATGGLTPQGIALGIGRKIRNISAGIFGGLALYFLALGQAAFMGFLVGAAVGMTAGLAFGIGISIALGPIGIIAAPVIIPLSMIAGGTIGGIAGGLLALGLYSGTATAVTTGIGVGVGGTTGAVIGGVVGSAFGPLGTFVGAMVGAYVGAFIGGAIGYAIGHYVIGTIGLPASGALAGATIGFYLGGPVGSLIGAGIGWLAAGGWAQIKNFFASTPTAVAGVGAGFFGAVGSFFTGLASTIWGGLSTAGGTITGFLSGAGNFLIGISGLSPSVAAAAVPVAGSIGAVAVGGTIVGIVTAATFFNPEGQFELPPAGPPGENQFFSVAKSASPERIADNNNLPQDITFTITLTAKETKLTNIQVSDEIKVQSRNSGDFNVTEVTEDGQKKLISEVCKDKIPPEILPRATWVCTFSITASKETPNFTDSLVANTVTIVAKPEGQLETTVSAVATVIIGNPPTICGIIQLQGPWAPDEKGDIDKTCRALDKSPKIVSLLQKAGTIYLIRIADGSYPSGQCAQVAPANTITIACRMAPEDFAKYVIIHELGHVLGNYNGGTYQSFLNQGIYDQEGLMPTYPFAPSLVTWGVEAESFAEMISDYVVSKAYNFNPRAWSGYPGGPWLNPSPSWTTFQKDRPVHYNFAKTEIFGGVEY